MTPREIIAQSLFDYSGSGQGVDDMLEAIAFEQSHAIFNDLKTAGFSIIHDSENHGPTVERAAVLADLVKSQREQLYAENNASINAHKAVQAEELASAIRALTTGGRDAA